MASSSKRPKVERNDSPFAEGSIARIKLENFLTYDSVEFRPGPSLNVIIGPNGTGKSTIVCAICLGLAGKPSLLGRALSPMEYIKHGCNKAVVEIELFNPHGDNYQIRREIHKDNSNKWSVNGRNASARNVEVTVAKLNIQVGNLCQFLPQDKVADFAKMSPQELLENTEKAVGPPEMFEQHQELKTARERERELQLTHTRVGEQLEQEKQMNSRLEQDVKNYQEREKHINKVNQLKTKRPWVEYEDKRKSHEAAKEIRLALAEQIRRARGQNAPLQKRLDAAQKRLKEVDVKMKKLAEAVKDQARYATESHKKLESTNDQVQELKDDLMSKRQEEVNRKKKVRDLTGQIQSLEAELANMEEDDIQPRLDKLNTDMTSLNRQMSQSQQRADTAKMRYSNIKRDITVLQTELKELQDLGNRRLEDLRRRHKDTYDAIQWLRANRHMFSGMIHEPMMLILNVKDPANAKYLESTISANDMRAFVCENNDDMKLFMDTTRIEQRLRINVIVAPNEPSSSFKPTQPIEQLRRYGFQSYLKDQFECPELVMRYLCRNYQVHKIPVGNAYTKANVETVINRNPDLRNFYTDNHNYRIKKSKYSNSTSSRCMELRRPTLLSTTFNSVREQELKREIETKQSEMRSLETEWRDVDKQHKEMEKHMDTLRNQKKDLMNQKNQRRNVLQKLNMKKDTLKRVDCEAIDLDMEEKMMGQKIGGILSLKCKMLKELQGFTQKCLKLSEDKVRQSLIYAETQHERQTIEETLREQSYSVKSLERDFEKQKETVRELKDSAMRLFNAAKRASNLRDDQQELPPDIKRVFDLLPSTLEEIDAAIHEEQARADCTFQTDQSVVQDYKQREKHIANLLVDYTKWEHDLQQHRVTIEETKEKWITPLKELVSRINNSFGYFFNCMKCAGEVDLHIPDNPEDYEKYGIKIKVMFRDKEQLRELTPHLQSGGERSVATVLYMMSLQDLTRVPFRCVDEINQGMDPHNERKIFELVVETACNNNNSQYFLLTPKLLPDLQYTHNMSILCVYNGPYMVDHTEWKLSKFIKRGQRLE